jgi:hypothetical protein
MSIINDALNKARKDRDENEKKQNQVLQGVEASRPHQPESPNNSVPQPAAQRPAQDQPKQEPKTRPEPKQTEAPVTVVTAQDSTTKTKKNKEKSSKITIHPIVYVIATVAIVIFAASYVLTRTSLHQKIQLPPTISININKDAAQEIEIESDQPIDVAPGRKASRNPGSSEFYLSGIIYGESSPMAVINDNIYEAGDMIGTAKVLDVSGNRVIIEKDGKQIELHVK